MRNHGKHGTSLLNKLLHTQKRGYTAVTDEEAEKAREQIRQFGLMEDERDARRELERQKQARLA